jgi:ATP-binding cassette subfamily B protein
MNTSADRPRSKTLNPLRALLPFIKPYRAMAVSAIAALVVASVAMLALPVAGRQIIDSALASKNLLLINRAFIGLLAASLIFGASAALRFYLVTRWASAWWRICAPRYTGGSFAWTRCSMKPRG